MKTIKGFKAYKKGLICKGFKFEEGKIYESDKAEVCKSGFHLCINPLDCLDYYDLCNSEFTEAEALGKIDKNKDDSKIATTKIKIGAKLSLKAFIEASVNFLLLTCKSKQQASIGDGAKQASSGYGAQQASSGYYAQQASSGNYAQQASSGNYAKQASSGNYAQQASSGNYAQQASSGDGAQQASSGYYAQQASSGDGAQQASSGYYAQQASSGDRAKQASSGYYAQQASSGYGAQQASSGDYAQQASSGNYAQQASSGYGAQQASSGDDTSMEINGQDSVAAGIGRGTKIKGKKGNWITLAEWKYDKQKNRWIPVCVKSAQIDGKEIKEDTWYQLENGKFVEVE